MNRPYIFCHMMTSLDGKIMGDFMDTPEGEIAGNVFYNISFGMTQCLPFIGFPRTLNAISCIDAVTKQ